MRIRILVEHVVRTHGELDALADGVTGLEIDQCLGRRATSV